MRWLLMFVSLLLSLSALAAQIVVRVGNETPIQLVHKEITTQFSPTSFATELPWYTDKNKFTGFKVSELLQYLQIDDAFAVSFVGLNDYTASARIADIMKYEPIVAYEMNDQKMKIRNKGPYWLVFNLDNNPEIDNAAFHSQMVWQIDEIVIHRNQDAEVQ